MKRKFLVIFTILILFNGVFAFAQPRKDLYIKNVRIVKILSHRLGYKVFYQMQSMGLNFFYVPSKWFTPDDKKATIIYGNAAEYPYFTIVWEEGEFAFVKLFLRENKMDFSWGILRAKVDEVKDDFDIDTLELQF